MSAVQRLGFDADATVAVVHADDIGMSHAANVGAFAAMRDGAVTCGSLMVPCPWFSEAAAWARAEPDLDLGVHLTLNAEYDGYRWGPVAGRSAVPTLVDGAGHFYRTVRETNQHASPAEVETELRAQVEAALEAGVDVTHLDSHMGTLFHPRFFDIYLQLAREYRLPLFLPRASVDALERADDVAEMEEARFVVFDGFCADSLDFAEGGGAAHNARRIADLTSGLNYLICHPAQGGQELSAIADTAHQRDFERQFYGGPEGRAALDAAGIETIGMRPLRDLLRAS